MLNQPYHARLQLLMLEWIKAEGLKMGHQVHPGPGSSYKIEDKEGGRVVDVTLVAMHMATAAGAAFEAALERY